MNTPSKRIIRIELNENAVWACIILGFFATCAIGGCSVKFHTDSEPPKKSASP